MENILILLFSWQQKIVTEVYKKSTQQLAYQSFRQLKICKSIFLEQHASATRHLMFDVGDQSNEMMRRIGALLNFNLLNFSGVMGIRLMYYSSRIYLRKLKPYWIIQCLGFLFLSSSVLADLPPGNVNAGAKIYNDICKGCHDVSIAPTLRGVINRPIASVSTFAGYTDGLKAKKNLQWTTDNLDEFLTNPAAFAPGTGMVQIISDPQERANIIAFLKALPPPRN